MTSSLVSSSSYSATEPAISLATIRAFATVVRKGEGLNNINRPIP